MPRLKATLALCLALTSLVACDSPEKLTQVQSAEGEKIAVTGRLAYSDRIALPAAGQIEVQLSDINLTGAPPHPVAIEIHSTKRMTMPLRFKIILGKEMIDPRRKYAVLARITGDDGKPMLITDPRNHNVRFDGRSEINMGTLQLVKTN